MKTPKHKNRLSLMLNTTTNNLKSGAESFADSNVAEGVKTQMTKEEIEKAEKDKIEMIKA